MLSFDFSVFDLVLSLGVIVLIALFVVTLWKLNPGKETTRSKDEEIRIEEHEPMFSYQQNRTRSQSDVQPSQIDTRQSGRKSISQSTPSPKVVVSAAIDGDSQISTEETPEPNEYVEPPKQTTPSSKSTQKNALDKDCFHFFGYLNGLPRNTPIPGECFGCQKIVDCLVTKKK